MAIGSNTTRPSTRWAMAGLSLSTLLSSLGTSSANVGLPAMALVFEASFQEVQWIVLAYLLAITTLMVVAGRVGDVIGRRRLLLAGIALFTAASILCGLAPTLGLLVAARALQGAGAAIMIALTMAVAGDVAGSKPSASRTGSAMGLLGAMSAIGTALGPTLGGVLIAGFNWRAIFLSNVPLGILTLVIAYRHLPADGGSTAATQPGFARTGALMRELLRDRTLGAGLAMNALVSTVMMATLVVGPFYLSAGLGMSTALAGMAMSAGPLVTALTSVFAGRMVDRFGPQRMTLGGLTALTAGSLALSLLPVTLGVLGYVLPIVVMTIGYALFQTANNTAVMANVRAEERGLISGVLQFSRNLGLVAGTSAMGAIFARGSAAADVTTADAAAVAAGMQVTFAVAAMLVAAALAIAIKNGTRRSGFNQRDHTYMSPPDTRTGMRL